MRSVPLEFSLNDRQIENYNFNRHSSDNIHPSRWMDADNDAKSVRADVLPSSLHLHSFNRRDFEAKTVALEKVVTSSGQLNATELAPHHLKESKEFIFAEKSPWYHCHMFI